MSCLFWIFRLSKTKKYAAYDRFHGNSPYGKIPTRKEPIRTRGFSLPYNNGTYVTRSFMSFIKLINVTKWMLLSVRRYMIVYIHVVSDFQILTDHDCLSPYISSISFTQSHSIWQSLLWGFLVFPSYIKPFLAFQSIPHDMTSLWQKCRTR